MESRQTELFGGIESEKLWLPFDKEREYPFVYNKYWANANDRTIWHCNSLYLNYNCNESDIKEVKGRIICNTKEEICKAFDIRIAEGNGDKVFIILSPLIENLLEFGYDPYDE
jgi:hypothetical protein